MPITIVVGAQWGDEGKGKIVDLLAERAQIVARYAGGPNAGHTIAVGERTIVLHSVPSGALREGVECVIGPGTVVDPEILRQEIVTVQALGVPLTSRLRVSGSAHVILPAHRVIERDEDLTRLGTTGRGIGQAYRDKAARTGIRVETLCDRHGWEAAVRAHVARVRPTLSPGSRDAPELDPGIVLDQLEPARAMIAPLVCDTSVLLHGALTRGAEVLAEGAQGSMLDVDHGTYPFVTSSTATAGGAITGLGIGPRWVRSVVGVTKAYATRVGEGPFPTELPPDESAALRESGHEYGATTGRPRRCGWLDLVALRAAVRVNGLDALIVTKLDVLDQLETLRVCTAYRIDGSTVDTAPGSAADLARCEPVYQDVRGWRAPTSSCRRAGDLPRAAREYIEMIVSRCGVPVALVSVGAERDATIELGGDALRGVRQEVRV
jgi:adenylosuccinate synthase